MSFFISYNDFLEDIGTAIPSYAAQVANTAKKIACFTWNLYPDRVTNNKFLPTAMSRGFMNRLCTPDNPPPPVTPPACAITCHVFGTYYSKNSSGGGCNKTAWWRTRSRYKPEDYTSFTPVKNASNLWVLPLKSGGESLIGVLNETSYNNDFTGSIAPVNLSFRDRTASCINSTGSEAGDSLVQKKTVPILPTDPSCEDATKYPVTNPPNIITKNYFIDVDGDTQIVVSPTIEKDEQGNFNFPLVIGYADFDIALDMGGFTFSFDIDKEYRRPGGGGGSAEPPILEPVEDEDEELNPDSPSLTKKPYGSIQGRTENVDGKIEFLEITIDTKPVNAKSQFGAGGQDLFYCGWVEFRANDKYYPRQPIHFLSTIVKPPAYSNGFSYTLYTGFSGSSIVTYLKDE